ncbi:hypothetical protein [Bosea sp. (in: a-proteobacteria)]|uniref:hypothetical protein n=1 Tax=Bosea sp. (in: a-proteobacteria) TaxID=1871050 RepID=UPI002FC762BF
MNQEITAILARVSQREGVPPALLLAVLAAMGQASGKPDFSRIEHDLTRKAGEFRSLRERLLKPSGTDPELDRLRAEAASSLTEGRFAEADRALAQAELSNLDGTVALDKMSQEKLLAAAAGRADRGATAMLRLNAEAYHDAAQRFAEAALIAGTASSEQARIYAWQQGDALARIGADFRDKTGFTASIAHFRAMLSKLDNFEETVPWAATQQRLARAVNGLARLQGDRALLRQAIELYRTALEDLGQKQAPALWAAIQSRFGETLTTLGEAEDDASMLEEGIAAFRAALAATDRSKIPAEWTRLNFELGRAYVALGLRASGAAALEAAINAFKRVLDDWQQAARPLDWAEVQDRIGAALCGLSSYYREPVVLEEAIAAFDAALLERRREMVPELWAASSGNRAEARLRLAEQLRERRMAEAAAAELMDAIETLRGLGLAAEAKRFEPGLIRAGALVEKLRKT